MKINANIKKNNKKTNRKEIICDKKNVFKDLINFLLLKQSEYFLSKVTAYF